MKCKSIAGIWPESPPSHRVTATAVIDDPPALYTGATDGSIIWWLLCDHLSSLKKIRPVALLCGHSAAIADLCICYPLLASSDSNTDRIGNVAANRDASNQGALLSACTDGVLCVWSRGSGHCRRRRKLPPWVGSPSMVRTLPANGRYVCVASCFTDATHAADHDLMDSAQGSEAIGDQDSLGTKHSQCTIVIVDSHTLTIVRTVFHGNLSIGPLKFMGVAEFADEKVMYSILMVDSFGNVHCIPLGTDSSTDKEGRNKLHDSSSLVNATTLENGGYEGGLVEAAATCGQILGLVYKTRCIFMLVPCATVIGVISFENDHLFSEADGTLSHIIGSMFICSGNTCTSNSGGKYSMLDVKFSVWNDRGFTVIYTISYVDETFMSEVICEIPPISSPVHVKLSTDFVQLTNYLLRVESIGFHDEEPFLWRPYITIWSLHQVLDHENFRKSCKLLGKGNLLVDWVDNSSNTLKFDESVNASTEEFTTREAAATLTAGVSGQEDNVMLLKDDLKHTSFQKGRIVTSTMGISQNFHIPYAVVYGYHSGEIELVQFTILTQEVDSDSINLHHEIEPQAAKRQFTGHSGAVLCLAAHCMVATSTERSCDQVLLSGSMDCTIRIWDLFTCRPLIVMHHHVAPVRQIILPPSQSELPWSDCFLSVGDDCCVSLVSLETLQVERMFPGHSSYPAKVVWDSVRGYLACLSQNCSVAAGAKDSLFIWDVKAGSRERVLRGTAAYSMFNNFCKGLDNVFDCASNYNTSSASLFQPLSEYRSSFQLQLKNNQSISTSTSLVEHRMASLSSSKNRTLKLTPRNFDELPIRCSCPISGITIFSFDLSYLVSPDVLGDDGGKQWSGMANKMQNVNTRTEHGSLSNDFSVQGKLPDVVERLQYLDIFKLCLLRFSLSFLHFWGVDIKLDNLLMMEMNVKRHEEMMLAPGLEGDRGSITLAFPYFSTTLQLWKSSSEFCALRSLTMVSLAQSMVSLSHSCSGASSALSAFYARNFAESIPDVRPPSLQLLVSFWQDEDEHVRLAARSLFHCAASRAIPSPLCCPKTTDLVQTLESVDHERENDQENAKKIETAASCLDVGNHPDNKTSQSEEADILKWLESYELQDWISCVGGTNQDAMASHIMVAAALAVWYPSLVKPKLAMLTVHPLMKLVMSMNEKYSSAAAELLAEGMDSTWKLCISSEIPHLIGDVFFQIECVSGASADASPSGPVIPPKLRETLVSVLLPSLALADIPGFLSVIEGLIWSTASDSPVHLISLKTLIRLMRGSPKNLAQCLNKVVNFILQTMDPANSVMRKTCIQSSMATLREVVRVYPMVALNDNSTRLAVGDAIAEIDNAYIHVYDMQSVTKIKVLDASGPPGLPTLLSGASETVTAAISVLSFTPDGEGLVAFSEHGLIIRWWSLGTAWWEKLSRNFVPVQCTKLILVPPWEGFSPNSLRASIMANIAGNGKLENSQEHIPSTDADSLNIFLYNLDLSYHMRWIGDRKVLLTRHGEELGTFLL